MSIQLMQMRAMVADAKKNGIPVTEGIACCPGCSANVGYTIISAVRFITCHECRLRIKPRKPNDFGGNRFQWEAYSD